MRELIADAIGDGLWAFDPAGRTLYVNAAVGDLLGYSRAELDRLQMRDVLDEVGRVQFERHLFDLAERGANVAEVECVFRHRTGAPVLLNVAETALYDEGRLVGYVHRLTPERAHGHLFDEVLRSRAQLADAQSIARIGSWEADLDTGVVTWSNEMFTILGLDEGDVRGNRDDFYDRVTPEDRGRVMAELESTGRDLVECRIEARIERPDGVIRWVRVIGKVLTHDSRGRATRLGGTVQDIDELKRAELELVDAVELNTLMQFMATSANEATTLEDALGRLRSLLLAHHDWRRAVAFRVVDGELVVWPVGGQDDVPDEIEWEVARRTAVAAEIVFDEESRPTTPSIGMPVPLGRTPDSVLVITARTPIERHQMMRALTTQVIGQLTEVAQRETVADELSRARDAAMDASRAKSEFLATMSHEIRTPLNGVIGLAELIGKTDLDPQQQRLLGAMRDAGDTLLALINDILDFSRIEAGELDLESVTFSPRAQAERVLGLLGPVAAERGIGLRYEVDPRIPQAVVGDPERWGQVLTNLVANAIKFTDEGEVVVRASVEGGDGATLRTEVRDTGIGMSPEQLERIFQPFHQADASTTRLRGGSGLGLAIATRLAHALDGTLGVTSEPGVGSVFWFTARFATADGAVPDERPAAETVLSAGGHVLVVEDNDINRMVALGMLSGLGVTAEVAEDGYAGVEMARSGRFDAVLMDLQMPGIDGFEATRRIRAQETGGERIPIIALTASAIDGEEARCRAAGMDGFLTKPLRSTRLAEALVSHLGGDTQARARRTDAADAPVDEILDASRIDELLEIGVEAVPLVQQALDRFITEAEDRVAELRHACAIGDDESLRQLAHRLKGSALNLGAIRVAEVAFDVEQRAQDDDLAAVPARLDELAVEVQRASAAMLAHTPARLARMRDAGARRSAGH